MVVKNFNKHEFSFYWPALTDYLASISTGDSFVLDDKELHRRISKILRLKVDEQIVLFDLKNHAQCKITAIDKQTLMLALLGYQQNSVYEPSITFLLPVLKRDALEQAVYGLVELGVNEIKLVNTQKVQRKWGGQKELDRLQHIMTAAAEQSKNYGGAHIAEPQELKKVIDELAQTAIFLFEPNGKDSSDCIQSLKTNQTKQIALIVGPEGDLTADEKEYLQQTGATLCKLTPTVLRAQQAAIVGAGIFRSLLD